MKELDRSQGGTQTIAFGGKNAGKSTLLQDWTVQALRQRQVCVWRGRDIDTWHVFAKIGRCLVHVPRDAPMRWALALNREDEGGEIAPADLDVEVTDFSTVASCIAGLERDRVNVVLTLNKGFDESLWWVKFFRELTLRQDSHWVHVATDEVDDIIPENPREEQYEVQAWLKDSVKDLRKDMINWRAAVHQSRHVDHRILTKFNYAAYLLRTGRPRPDSPVRPRYLRTLRRQGVGIIEDLVNFGKFRFTRIPPAWDPQSVVKVMRLSNPSAMREDLRGARHELEERSGRADDEADEAGIRRPKYRTETRADAAAQRRALS